MTEADHPIHHLSKCRTPQDVHALIEEHGMDWGLAYHVALARCPKTPLGDALRVFWYYDPREGLMLDRTTEEAGLLFEIIKRVEIDYYPKAGVSWSHFDKVPTPSEEVEDLVEELQGIVPICMFGTEFN